LKGNLKNPKYHSTDWKTAMSKYEPLAHLLSSTDAEELSLDFAEIERALHAGLPPSASAYREWWANDKTHSQAKAWMAAGWQVWSVDLAGQRVVFRRNGAAVRPPGRPQRTTPSGSIQISIDALSSAALKQIDDQVRQTGGDRAAAIISILNATGAEHRRAVFDWFEANRAAKPGPSSADLIREDRDAR
jgi:hypothetical protein